MKQISFLINTSINELEHIKLLLNSLQLNLDNKKHEILIFIDSDTNSRDTYNYLKSIKKDFFDLKIITHKLPPCIGYSRNNNLLVELANYDIVSYLQSDMVISPHYDTDVLKQLEPNTILSATRVEPPLHGESDKTITKNLGVYPKDFNLEEWNKYSLTVKQNKDTNYFFAPITFYKQDWLDIGGYDTLFRRSREDSDFAQRCLYAGIKLKQTYNTVVYHFTCTSSRGADWFNQQNKQAQQRVELQDKADQVEAKRFIRKWGGFNHGAAKLIKYDIDLVVYNCKALPLDFLDFIEPLFSKVWLDDDYVKENLILLNNNNHKPANELNNFTEEQWEVTSQYHNLIDFNKIFLPYSEFNNQYHILLELDGNSIKETDMQLLNYLHPVISDKGNKEGNEYTFNNIKIKINRKIPLNNTIIKNPPFNMDLLKIE
tara:strand:- start:95 stop:1384 length:1290 start_codon:yes stop_codon:yes gene_type:complete